MVLRRTSKNCVRRVKNRRCPICGELIDGFHYIIPDAGNGIRYCSSRCVDGCEVITVDAV